MLLEKVDFLGKAIESSAEEILEEMDILLEGGDVKTSVEFVTSIIHDLLNTYKNLDKMIIPETDVQEIEKEELFEEYPFSSESGLVGKFEIGEKIQVIRPFSPTPSLLKSFKCTEKAVFEDPCSERFEAVVVAISKCPYGGGCAYIVDKQGKKFFTPESWMEKMK